MARYLTVEEAETDGVIFEHRAEESRFVVIKDDHVIGSAHYTLDGDRGVDFDGTVVTPKFRGTGISLLLAKTAFTDELFTGLNVNTSCWFMERVALKHPEFLK